MCAAFSDYQLKEAQFTYCITINQQVNRELHMNRYLYQHETRMKWKRGPSLLCRAA